MRAAFVPTQAGPLAGDRDSARIVVGAGATLVVEPVAATLALPGAARTFLRLDVTVRAGGRLVLDEGPLIVAAGADVQRRCIDRARIRARSPRCARRSCSAATARTAGTLDSALRVTLAGRPLLHDGLRIAARGADDHVALAPGHRVVASACLLGMRPPPRPDACSSSEPGAICRATGSSLAHVDAALAAPWHAWRELCGSSHTAA